LKHHVLDLVVIAFWPGEEEENDFAWPGVLWKHRSLNLAKVAFCVGQTAENVFANQEDPLKQHFRYRTSRILAQQRGRKLVCRDWHPLKHRFLDLAQITFILPARMGKMYSQG
jgi:hypothetical protein